MRKSWPQMAIPVLLLIILVSTGAQNDPFQQTHQVQPAETKLAGSVGTIVPQMWGALGDGVHNDAAAIQAAINSGATEIFLPPGTANGPIQAMSPPPITIWGPPA